VLIASYEADIRESGFLSWPESHGTDYLLKLGKFYIIVIVIDKL
jgi:hypothetical protein